MITGDKNYVLYMDRVRNREFTLGQATMNFVGYFMTLGDDQATAEGKVGQVSTEVAQYLYVYTLGNTQPLIDAINASTLPFMDAAAKAKLTGDLTPTNE
jgi:hypothetical protein